MEPLDEGKSCNIDTVLAASTITADCLGWNDPMPRGKRYGSDEQG